MTFTKKDLKEAILDTIHSADIDFEVSGYKNERDEDLILEKWGIQDGDAVVNDIFDHILRYLEEVL